jgi:hypothetical protein
LCHNSAKINSVPAQIQPGNKLAATWRGESEDTCLNPTQKEQFQRAENFSALVRRWSAAVV